MSDIDTIKALFAEHLGPINARLNRLEKRHGNGAERKTHSKAATYHLLHKPSGKHFTGTNITQHVRDTQAMYAAEDVVWRVKDQKGHRSQGCEATDKLALLVRARREFGTDSHACAGDCYEWKGWVALPLTA